MEILMTQTIFQTTGLHSLSIAMKHVGNLSAAPVIAWLMYTRHTLRHLHCCGWGLPAFHILKSCSGGKLEVLALAHNAIGAVQPSYQRFPCLRCLSLSYVRIDPVDLGHLLTACPMIEVLELVNIMTCRRDMMGLTSSSLKEVNVEGLVMVEFTVKAERLEKLRLQDCKFSLFSQYGKGSLRVFTLNHVKVMILSGIGENLELVDISNSDIVSLHLDPMFSTSPNLRRLRLWDVEFKGGRNEVDLETIAISFPRLSHLSLSHGPREEMLGRALQGPSLLQHLLVLELRSPELSFVFLRWVTGVLERCPNLKNLIVYRGKSEAKTQHKCCILVDSAATLIQLARIYKDVEFAFKIE